MQNLNGYLHPGTRDRAFLLVLIMEDGQMEIVFSLIVKIREILFLKDVSGNRGGMCIGRTLGENLIFQDRPGQRSCVNTALSEYKL